MYPIYVIVTVLAALAAAAAAVTDVVRADWVRGNMAAYGVPEWALMPLAVIKAIGAAGLLAGLWLPPVGLAAAIGLVIYFLGAVGTVLRARYYGHLGYPLPYLVLAAGSVALYPLA